MADKGKRVLVTGATGGVGSALVELLRERGVAVRAATRSKEKAQALRRKGVDAAVVDYADVQGMAPAFEGVERLFLLTPLDREMVRMTAAIVAAAKRAGVKRIVKLSAMGAGEGRIALARMHREAERVVESSGIEHAFLRPAPFMQNLLRMASIKEEGVLYAPAAEGKVAMIDVRDVAAAAAALLAAPRLEQKAYTLTGPELLSYGDVARILGEALGRRIAYVDVSEASARRSMAGMPAWMADALLELYAETRAGRLATLTGTLEELTGRPGRTLAQFAKEHSEEFAQQPAAEAARRPAEMRA